MDHENTKTAQFVHSKVSQLSTAEAGLVLHRAKRKTLRTADLLTVWGSKCASLQTTLSDSPTAHIHGEDGCCIVALHLRGLLIHDDMKRMLTDFNTNKT